MARTLIVLVTKAALWLNIVHIAEIIHDEAEHGCGGPKMRPAPARATTCSRLETCFSKGSLGTGALKPPTTPVNFRLRSKLEGSRFAKINFYKATFMHTTGKVGFDFAKNHLVRDLRPKS